MEKQEKRIRFQLYFLPKKSNHPKTNRKINRLQDLTVIFSIPEGFREALFRRAFERLIEFFPDGDFQLEHVHTSKQLNFKFGDVDHIEMVNYRKRIVENPSFNGHTLILNDFEKEFITSTMNQLKNRRLSTEC
ncbi:hypothetical protein ACYRFS_12865 [Listeria kieliensis]